MLCVVIKFIIDLISHKMDNYDSYGAGGGSKYTLDDLNEATGVTSSNKNYSEAGSTI